VKKTTKLRQLFDQKEIIRIAGAHDGLTAKLAEKNGFDGIWASGFEISTSYAVPDANILTMSQYLERACEMENSANIPIVADCDTGYGNVSNVIYMIKQYENAGIAAVCIEDKLFPKMNSFIKGRQELATIGEFVGKIMAAKKTQKDKDFMLIARVEALIAGHGMEEAVKRASHYVEAGADAILIHSKKSTSDEIIQFCKIWAKRAPLVIVPTTYPDININDMKELGVKLIIYANQGIRAAIKSINKVFHEIITHNDLTKTNDSIASMDEAFNLQGMRQLKKDEELFTDKKKNVKVIIPAAGDPTFEESLKEITKYSPVAMLDISGKSILQRNVELLYDININDITVITGYYRDCFNVEGVKYISNKDYKTNSQIDSIMKGLLDTNSIILFSDILFDKEILLRLLDYEKDIILVIDSDVSNRGHSIDYVVAETPPTNHGRKISRKKLNRVNKIGKDISFSTVNFEFIGISYFSKNGVDILKKTYTSLLSTSNKNDIDFLSVIQNIIDQGITVYGLEVNGGWIEVRSFENYAEAYSVYS